VATVLRPAVVPIVQQLKNLDLQGQEVIALVMELGLNEGDILGLLTVDSSAEMLIMQEISAKLDLLIADLVGDTTTQPPVVKGRFHMSSALKDDGTEKMTYVLTIDDATGQLAKLIGPEVWAIDNVADGKLTPAPDGLSAVVNVVPNPTNEGHQIVVTATTPTLLADGVTAGPPIVETDTIVITAGGAATAVMTGTVSPA
jgi:hypothetical protein